MIAARVNGAPVELEEGTCVLPLVHAHADRDTGVAVAVNGEVVPRSEWADTPIVEGDRVEILVAAQGG